jgi:hypothetical protein
MADTPISGLTSVSSLGASDEFAVNQGGTSKKVTAGQVESFFETKGFPAVFALGTSHTLAATAATEVTGLGPCTLVPGTYYYTYELIVQSSATATGIGLGINFTGTAAVRTIRLVFPSTGTTAITGVMDDVGANTGQIMEHITQTAFSTSAPNMINTAGFATANANVPVTITGILVVTVSGDLELWHSSETAANTSVMAGSSLVVIRTA